MRPTKARTLQTFVFLILVYGIFFFLQSYHVLQTHRQDLEKMQHIQGMEPIPPEIINQFTYTHSDLPPQTQSQKPKEKDKEKSRSPLRIENKSNVEKGMIRNLVKSMAIYVIACKRPNYLQRTLESLSKLTGASDYPIIVSQDGFHEETAGVARSFHYELVQHTQPLHLKSSTKFVANHYKEAFKHAFEVKNFSKIIVVEEDMVFAPDFITYFEATIPIMEQDPSIMCISTWNDNGFGYMVNDTRALMRTSYFPGLGWLVTSKLWNEIKSRWPEDHWDHWMRLYPQHKNRDCIIPEVSRNYNIGEVGANINNQAYKKYLSAIQLNDRFVDFGDITYLLDKNYSARLQTEIAMAKEVRVEDLDRLPRNQSYYLPYVRENFPKISAKLGIWNIPRPHHRFVSTLKWKCESRTSEFHFESSMNMRFNYSITIDCKTEHIVFCYESNCIVPHRCERIPVCTACSCNTPCKWFPHHQSTATAKLFGSLCCGEGHMPGKRF
eukprot:TRINITY_DN8076_c0_g1_i3.p1 TRINITY_DN8076_c0_g1~~TRINITY_DN8076_c0_g1_i3.p1  ORF type:complete len:495 (+),score=72.65 TRINITY_DN8076_c0_g1_i3:53-1537(+)